MSCFKLQTRRTPRPDCSPPGHEELPPIKNQTRGVFLQTRSTGWILSAHAQAGNNQLHCCAFSLAYHPLLSTGSTHAQAGNSQPHCCAFSLPIVEAHLVKVLQ